MRWVLVALLTLAVAAVLAAPTVARRVLVDRLASMPGYEATAESVQIRWLYGSAAVSGIVVERPGVSPPFVTVDRALVRPRYAAWFRGERLADAVVDGLTVHYVLGPDEARSQTEVDAAWLGEQLEQLPFALDRLHVRSGAFEYHDRAASPDVDLRVAPLRIEATGLAAPGAALDGHATIRGRVQDAAPLFVSARFAPAADPPRFEVDASVTDLPIPSVNDALRAYTSVDAEAGTFTVDSRITGRGGAFHGRAQPLVEGLKLREDKDKEPPLRAAWEAIASVGKDVAELVTPGRDDEVVLSVPIEGTFGEQLWAVQVLEALPRAWLGSLQRAVRVGGGAAEEAGRGAREAAEANQEAR